MAIQPTTTCVKYIYTHTPKDRSLYVSFRFNFFPVENAALFDRRDIVCYLDIFLVFGIKDERRLGENKMIRSKDEDWVDVLSETLFSVGKYFHPTWQYPDRNSKRQFLFYIAKSVDSVVRAARSSKTRGVVCNFHPFTAMSSISRRRGRALCRGEGNKFRRVALLWSIKGLPGAFTQS